MAMYFLLQKVQDFLTRNLKTNVNNDCTSGVFLLYVFIHFIRVLKIESLYSIIIIQHCHISYMPLC